MKPFWRHVAVCERCGNILKVDNDDTFMDGFFLHSCDSCGKAFDKYNSFDGFSVIRVRYDGVKKDNWYQIIGRWSVTIDKADIKSLSARAKKKFMSTYNVIFGEVEI
jgi:hypothetical protein